VCSKSTHKDTLLEWDCKLSYQNHIVTTMDSHWEVSDYVGGILPSQDS